MKISAAGPLSLGKAMRGSGGGPRHSNQPPAEVSRLPRQATRRQTILGWVSGKFLDSFVGYGTASAVPLARATQAAEGRSFKASQPVDEYLIRPSLVMHR